MKQLVKLFLLIFICQSFYLQAQDKFNYTTNEYLKYKVSFSFFDVADVLMIVKDENYLGKPHFFISSEINSSSYFNALCKIKNKYETFIDKETAKPSKFFRKTNDCRNKNEKLHYQLFDFNKNIVNVLDKEINKTSEFKITSSTEDLLSSSYKLRNINTDKLKNGDSFQLDVFRDNKIYYSKLIFLGRESIKTNFGLVKTIKIQTNIEKEDKILNGEEKIITWVSDDKNHVPLKVEMKLKFGTLKINLKEYKNLKYPINLVIKN